MHKISLALLSLAVLMVFAVGCSNEKNPVDSNTSLLQFRPTSPDAPALGGRVWNDMNMDGIQGMFAEEPGMPGVRVDLYMCGDTAMNDTFVLATTVTDSFGFYAFDMLEPGDYYLAFIRPDDYMFSPADMGDNDSLDSDVDTMSGMTPCITVDTGSVDLMWSAGMYLREMPSGMIGDRVWFDMNGDGIQDDPMDEPGIAGVVVYLAPCYDTIMDDTVFLASTITDSMGFYAFDGLEADNYALAFMLPDGYMFSPVDMGGDDAFDSDVDPMTGMTACFFIDTDMANPDQDAGMYMPDDGCTRSKGYWKNHAGFGPQDDMVTDLLPIWLGHDLGDSAKSMAVTDAQMAVDILHQHVYDHPSNGITKLYAQLLAAKLNIANGANGGDVEDYIMEADDFLTDYDWMDWDDLEKDQQKEVLEWKDIFDDYNKGEIGPGHCDDMDDNDDMK